MKIRFLGAAKTVTGSFHIIETEQLCFAIDCGLFQGSKEIKERNYQDFVVNPRNIDFLILTHAHIDHSGLIPKLCRLGFSGPIYCNPATAELCRVLLPDSGHIQESEVERKNRKLSRAGKEELKPIYTADDATNCLSQLRPINYDEIIDLAPGVSIRLRDAGHILGSSIVELWVEEEGKKSKLVFTGDLGQGHQPIIKDPAVIESADILVMESTYGDRFHKGVFDRVEQLKQVIEDTMAKGGNLVIPSFAVERTQDILYDLNQLYTRGELDTSIDIYIDSPLAIAATEIFKNSAEYYDDETRKFVESGNHPFKLPNLKYSRTQEESMELNKLKGRSIIISASGMCDAGRIKHHLKYNLWRPESTVLFIGYQAVGTLGRKILDGEKLVRIHGEQVAVKADIKSIEAYSAHADQAGLLSWIKKFDNPPEKIFLVHGEEEAQKVLADLIESELKIPVLIPNWLDEHDFTVEKKVESVSGFESLATAVQVESAYFDLRTKINRMFEEEYNKGNFEQLMAKINKMSNVV